MEELIHLDIWKLKYICYLCLRGFFLFLFPFCLHVVVFSFNLRVFLFVSMVSFYSRGLFFVCIVTTKLSSRIRMMLNPFDGGLI